MSTVLLRDATGTPYNVPEELLTNPPSNGSEPTRRLWDPNGTPYDLPENLFQPEPADAQTRSGAGSTGTPARSLTPSEKQLQVFLEQTGLPDNLKKIFWAYTYQLALTKITSKEDYRRLCLSIENHIRLLFIEGTIDPDTSMLSVEQLEFWATSIELNRAITYDGKPNERELWTIQQVHQKVDTVAPQSAGTSGGILQSAYRFIKGG